MDERDLRGQLEVTNTSDTVVTKDKKFSSSSIIIQNPK